MREHQPRRAGADDRNLGTHAVTSA
jgi:hypothetical protein